MGAGECFKEPCAFSSIFAWLPGAHKREKSINSCPLAPPRARSAAWDEIITVLRLTGTGAFMYRYQKGGAQFPGCCLDVGKEERKEEREREKRRAGTDHCILIRNEAP
jgi:acyl CoA:acetate/3-ketoacid CoA transferase alpha subunit